MAVRGVPRRTLAEIEQRYILEPTLRDLYVEGEHDKRIYEWYLKERDYNDVAVFNIGTIDISPELLNTHGLGTGNRDRVIALAIELDQRFEALMRNVRCIADADFNFVKQAYKTANHLLYTDYTSLDLYTYEPRTIGKLTVMLGITEADVQWIFHNMTPVLKDLFIARASAVAMDLGVRFPNFVRYCALSNETVAFNREACLQNWLNSNGLAHRLREFEEMCANLGAMDLSDDRMCIHGRDYFELLSWVLEQRFRSRRNRFGGDEIQKLLSMAIEADRLSQEHLFLQIERALGQ